MRRTRISVMTCPPTLYSDYETTISVEAQCIGPPEPVKSLKLTPSLHTSRARYGHALRLDRGAEVMRCVLLDDDPGELAHRCDQEGRDGPEFFVRREHDGLGRAAHQRALDGRLFEIAGGQAFGRMHAGHPKEIGVGPQSADRLDRGCADRHHRMLEKAPADHDHLDIRAILERHRNGGAVLHDGGTELTRQAARELERRRAAVEHDD